MPNRQYSEREVGRLLKRATELQDADPTHHGPGLTLEEIEQIARESGIDPRYIRAAASDPFSSAEPNRSFQWLGGPTRIESERLLPGSLDDEKWAAGIRELRHTFGTNGLASEVGATREWGAIVDDIVETQVSVAPREERSHARVSQRFTSLASLMFFVTMFIMAIVSLAVLKKSVDAPLLIEWLIWSGVLATTFGALRVAFGRITRNAAAKQADLLNRFDVLFGASENQDDLEPVTRRESAPLKRNANIELPDEASEGPERDAMGRPRERS